VLKEKASGKDPKEVGERAGDILLQRGADKILEEVYGAGIAAPQQP
jgi:hypothetical protein